MRMRKDDLAHGLVALDVHQDGPERYGFGDATVSAPVGRTGEALWLRVAAVPAPPLWPRPDAPAEAWRALGGRVPMPGLLERAEWQAWDAEKERAATVRAQLYAYCTAAAVSATPDLHHIPDVSDGWWRRLADASRVIPGAAAWPGMPKRMFLRYLERAGVDPTGAHRIPWVAQHCDWHWANLAGRDADDFTVLDWEGYSLAPAGFDAATLLAYSLLSPDTAARVREAFADALATEAGRLVQVFAGMLVMTAIDAGHHPGLAAPLRSHLARLTS
ncbi:hypothetical protein [Nocardiopsis halophila]|uniref:hypothetical protein n=1 Tax=Nocardiopsis halophila TaxID=141692 RepID=UPI000345AD9A|nr:hypothetical protein [Nocardiopsis halophila]